MRTGLFIAAAATVASLLFPNCSPARKFEQDSENSAFLYREVFLPEAIGKGADTLNLNTVDEDWAIWGHNMSKVVPDKHSESIYAKVNGATNKKQYCFSSSRLFEYICDYIDSRYDEKDKARFAIVPNDNDIVCLDAKCVAVGNTRGDASPAVLELIRKLAAKYPNHIFYTSDYRTTQNMPEEKMPENTGVMVSAMPYPFTLAENPDKDKFMERLDAWSTKTNRILIWDYINNFDDYFTPYPIFGIMQDRLKNYKDHNVTAVFLNGSGTDASSMSRLKASVLASLTANPDTNWRELLMTKAIELYPVTGETIANFMLAQEDFVQDKKTTLPLYEGVANARHTYLPEGVFVLFYDKLKELLPKTSGQEHKDIEQLLGQMALTRLELNRLNSTTEGSDELLQALSALTGNNIESYNETGWRVDTFVQDYNYLLKHAREVGESNLLKGVQIKALTPLDPDYSDISIVTDGMLSIPSNYHDGQLINTPERESRFVIPYEGKGTRLVVWPSYNTGYRIFLPQSVSVHADGMEKVTLYPSYPLDHSGHAPLEFEIPPTVSGNLILTLKKDPETRSMALEEIELF